MDAYREHRVRTSLGRAAAETPESPETLRRQAAAVWRGGRGVMFFTDQLDAMNPQERAAIEAAAERIYGGRRNNG
jgi:hypothetical protein